MSKSSPEVLCHHAYRDACNSLEAPLHAGVFVFALYLVTGWTIWWAVGIFVLLAAPFLVLSSLLHIVAYWQRAGELPLRHPRERVRGMARWAMLAAFACTAALVIVEVVGTLEFGGPRAAVLHNDGDTPLENVAFDERPIDPVAPGRRVVLLSPRGSLRWTQDGAPHEIELHRYTPPLLILRSGAAD